MANEDAATKAFAIGASFPSGNIVTLSVPATNSTIIAPDNGWMFMKASTGGSGGSGSFVILNSNGVAVSDHLTTTGAYGIRVSIPVKKGAGVIVEYANVVSVVLQFITAQGNI